MNPNAHSTENDAVHASLGPLSTARWAANKRPRGLSRRRKARHHRARAGSPNWSVAGHNTPTMAAWAQRVHGQQRAPASETARLCWWFDSALVHSTLRIQLCTHHGNTFTFRLFPQSFTYAKSHFQEHLPRPPQPHTRLPLGSRNHAAACQVHSQPQRTTEMPAREGHTPQKSPAAAHVPSRAKLMLITFFYLGREKRNTF